LASLQTQALSVWQAEHKDDIEREFGGYENRIKHNIRQANERYGAAFRECLESETKRAVSACGSEIERELKKPERQKLVELKRQKELTFIQKEETGTWVESFIQFYRQEIIKFHRKNLIFDEEKQGQWKDAREFLKENLSSDEYDAARESTLTAFYTPKVVIDSIYQALSNMGFERGNILEPSMGTGRFLGNLPESMQSSKFYGVELDSISGMIASKLIEVPGISENFIEGIVSYSNEAKIKRLKVKKETLEKYGAVSEEVAREMLAGLKTDVGISTTGIAGPGGGTKNKPVGLVYIGIKVKDEVKVFRRELKGDRNKIRQRAMMHALYNLLKILK